MSSAAGKSAILRKMMGGRPGAHLFGRRQVGLSRAEIKKNANYGTAPDRDEQWPLRVADSNPVAAAFIDKTKEA